MKIEEWLPMSQEEKDLRKALGKDATILMLQAALEVLEGQLCKKS